MTNNSETPKSSNNKPSWWKPNDLLYKPAVGMIIENEKGSKFEIVGFQVKNKQSKKLLKQLFKNGTHGDKSYFYTDEELIEQIKNQSIKII